MDRTKPLLFLLGGTCGFVLAWMLLPGARDGRAGRDDKPVRSATTRGRDVVEIERAELEELRATLERLSAPDANVPLKGDYGLVHPDLGEPEYAVGTRRPDGTIAGGARWSNAILLPSLAFLEGYLERFLVEAEIREDQKEAVRASYERVSRMAMQGMADYINADEDADKLYEKFDDMFQRENTQFEALLTPEQYKKYGEFVHVFARDINEGVIRNEIQNLRVRLDLDPEQERVITGIVRERYEAVGAKLRHGIPNMFFKAVRRQADQAIYDETAQRIREHLRPGQAGPFDKLEKEGTGPGAFESYRKTLVPK